MRRCFDYISPIIARPGWWFRATLLRGCCRFPPSFLATGLVTVHAIDVVETLLGVDVTCPENYLEVAESMVCSATYLFTQVGVTIIGMIVAVSRMTAGRKRNLHAIEVVGTLRGENVTCPFLLRVLLQFPEQYYAEK